MRSSILLTDAVVDELAVIDRAIIDKNVHIGPRSKIGYGVDTSVPNETDPRLNTGITLIGKNTVIPPGMTVGRNCVIASDLPARAFQQPRLKSGKTVREEPGFKETRFWQAGLHLPEPKKPGF